MNLIIIYILKNKFIFLYLYVNDILVSVLDLYLEDSFLSRYFDTKDLGKIDIIIGM